VNFEENRLQAETGFSFNRNHALLKAYKIHLEKIFEAKQFDIYPEQMSQCPGLTKLLFVWHNW